MEKERKIKTLSLVALVVAVLGLTVAFAALSTQLTISGSATVNPSEWNVQFANVSKATLEGGATVKLNTDGTEIAATLATTTTTNDTIELPEITLIKPGSQVTYTFDVVNSGTIDAKINEVSLTKKCVGDESDVALVCTDDYFIFTLEDITDPENPVEVAENQTLDFGKTKTMRLTVGYKKTAEDQKLPSNDIKINDLIVSVKYVQAD